MSNCNPTSEHDVKDGKNVQLEQDTSSSTGSKYEGSGCFQFPTMWPPKFSRDEHSYLGYVKAMQYHSPEDTRPLFCPPRDPGKIDVIALDLLADGSLAHYHIFKALTSKSSNADDEQTRLRFLFGAESTPQHSFHELRSFLQDKKPDHIFTRLYLIEDLSPATIELFGSRFCLPPTLFLSHLGAAADVYTTKQDPFPSERKNARKPFVAEKTGASHAVWRKPVRLSLLSQEHFSLLKKGGAAAQTVDFRHNVTRSMGQVVFREYEHNAEHLAKDTKATDAALEERFSFLRVEEEVGWTGIMLFDPKPELWESHANTQLSLANSLSTRSMFDTPSFAEFSQGNSGASILSATTRDMLVEYLMKTKTNISSERCTPAFYLDILNHYILSDWNALFQHVHELVDEIDSKMSDNNELQKNLLAWRKLIGNWRKTLVEDIKKIQGSKETDTTKYSADFKVTMAEASLLLERIERTFAALMSSMAIVESQRAIQQAESVSRLTELAFFFIPISFGSSVFGADISGWTYKPSMFFALLFGLSAGAYGFRILFRSRPVTRAIQRAPASARNFKGLKPDAKIQNSTWVKWAMYKIWPLATLSALTALAVALVCTLSGDSGVQVGVSVAVGAVWVLGVVYLAWDSWAWRRWEKERTWEARVDVKEEGLRRTKTGVVGNPKRSRVWAFKTALFSQKMQKRIRKENLGTPGGSVV